MLRWCRGHCLSAARKGNKELELNEKAEIAFVLSAKPLSPRWRLLPGHKVHSLATADLQDDVWMLANSRVCIYPWDLKMTSPR